MYLRPPITGLGPTPFGVIPGLLTGTGSVFAAGGGMCIPATDPLCGTVGGGGGPAEGQAALQCTAVVIWAVFDFC